MKLINIIYALLLFSLYSCIYNNQFIVYPNENANINEEYISSNFKLYFNVDDIKNEYDIIAVIGTNTYYYGQFFFDNVFMSLLEKKVYSLNGNAALYEKGRKNYTDYDDRYLYFTILYIKENNELINIKILE